MVSGLERARGGRGRDLICRPDRSDDLYSAMLSRQHGREAETKLPRIAPNSGNEGYPLRTGYQVRLPPHRRVLNRSSSNGAADWALEHASRRNQQAGMHQTIEAAMQGEIHCRFRPHGKRARQRGRRALPLEPDRPAVRA